MKSKKCLVKKCNRDIVSYKHRLCHAHLMRFYKGTEVNTPIRKYKKRTPR